MATFVIRRNHPYTGAITLCKIAQGSFVPKEMVVTEAAFVHAVMEYLKKMTPADKARLRQAAPQGPTPPVPQSNGDKKFTVNKAASAAP